MDADEELRREIRYANLSKNFWQFCQNTLDQMTDKQKANTLAHIHMQQLHGNYETKKLPTLFYNFKYDIGYDWDTNKWSKKL